MRDEILKRVPRPIEVRRWINSACRPADQQFGRSLFALQALLLAVCRRELSSSFRDQVLRRIDSLQLPLGQDQIDVSACKGGPLEDQVVSYMNLIAMDPYADMRTVAIESVSRAIIDRIEALIRDFEVNAVGSGDQEIEEGLRHMQRDSEAVDTHVIAREWLSGDGSGTLPQRELSVSPDEDLLGAAPSAQEHSDE